MLSFADFCPISVLGFPLQTLKRQTVQATSVLPSSAPRCRAGKVCSDLSFGSHQLSDPHTLILRNKEPKVSFHPPTHSPACHVFVEQIPDPYFLYIDSPSCHIYIFSMQMSTAQKCHCPLLPSCAWSYLVNIMTMGFPVTRQKIQGQEQRPRLEVGVPNPKRISPALPTGKFQHPYIFHKCT